MNFEISCVEVTHVVAGHYIVKRRTLEKNEVAEKANNHVLGLGSTEIVRKRRKRNKRHVYNLMEVAGTVLGGYSHILT